MAKAATKPVRKAAPTTTAKVKKEKLVIARAPLDDIEQAAPITDEAISRLIGAATPATTLPLKALCSWPLNPRQTDPAGAEGIAELAGSIAAQGQLSPLIVRDLGRPSFIFGPNLHEVIAGERRRQALTLLAEDGRLAVDHPVDVKIVDWDDTTALLAAGAENMARADMHAMDEALLFEALLVSGLREVDIAAKLGTPERTVSRRRRLIRLIPEARDAFRAGLLNKSQADAMATGSRDRQATVLPRVLNGNRGWEAGSIVYALQADLPRVQYALFPRNRYVAEGGEIGGGNGAAEVFEDVELFRRLQEEAISARIGELREKWPWVERIEEAHGEVPTWGKHAWAANPPERFPGAGAVVAVSPDLTAVTVREDMLRPGELERWTKAVDDGRAEEIEAAREAEAAGEAVRAPGPDATGDGAGGEAGDGIEGPAPGEAARLMTQGQIEFVRAAQTEALREAVSRDPKTALAWTILVMMGAVEELSITPAQNARAREGDGHLTAVFDRLRPIWPDCPTREELKQATSRRFIWLSHKRLAASCFLALLELDIETLAGLLAEVAASRIACWHDPYNSARTPFVSRLNAEVARAARADDWLPEFWRPEKEFWKGYDLIGLKVALNHAEFDPAGLTGAKKGELVATLCDVSTDLTAGLPELRFTIASDQEDAVIAARAAVIAVAAPPAAPESTEEREAA